jgi:transcriptional regulator with XRE-family HTH domain
MDVYVESESGDLRRNSAKLPEWRLEWREKPFWPVLERDARRTVGQRMRSGVRERARQDLEDKIRIFQSKSVRRDKWGWVRGVRQVTGLPVEEMARRMKVCKAEVYRIEISELNDKITLKKLRAAADALGCELVYAVVPVEGRTLEELAADAVRYEVRRGRGPKRGTEHYGMQLLMNVKTMLALCGWWHGSRKKRKRSEKGMKG